MHWVPCEKDKDPTDLSKIYASPIYKTSERKAPVLTPKLYGPLGPWALIAFEYVPVEKPHWLLYDLYVWLPSSLGPILSRLMSTGGPWPVHRP